MPLNYQSTLAADTSDSRDVTLNFSKSHHPRSLASHFIQENENLAAFCQAWNSQLARGARDSFSWVQELTPAEGLTPFSMAIPTVPGGGGSPLSRSLERRGTWQPELTEDLLDALDQAGPNSVFIDIGAGLGWFSFAAVSANHSALAIEIDNIKIAAMKRSACANSLQQHGNFDFTLLGNSGSSGKASKTQRVGVDMTDTLVTLAPRMIEALSAPIQQQQQQAPPQSQLLLKEEQAKENVVLPLPPRGSAVLVHPHTSREALEIMLAGTSILWPEVKPLVIALILPAEKESNLVNLKIELEQHETEEIASSVFHKMHALGYDVRMDAVSNMAQAPASFASLAAMVARGNFAESVAVWFTWKGKRLY